MNLIFDLLILLILFPFLTSSSSSLPSPSTFILLNKAVSALKKHVVLLRSMKVNESLPAFVDLSFITSRVDASVFLGILMYEFVGVYDVYDEEMEDDEAIQPKLINFTILLVEIVQLNSFLHDYLKDSTLGKDLYDYLKDSIKSKESNLLDHSVYPQFLHMASIELLNSWKEMDIFLLITTYVYWLECIVRGKAQFQGPSIYGSLLSLSLLNNGLIEPDLKEFLRFPSYWSSHSQFTTPQQDLRNLTILSSLLMFSPDDLLASLKKNPSFSEVIYYFTKKNANLKKIMYSLAANSISPCGNFELFLFCSKILDFSTPKECLSFRDFIYLPPNTNIISDSSDELIEGFPFPGNLLQYYPISQDNEYFLFTYDNLFYQNSDAIEIEPVEGTEEVESSLDVTKEDDEPESPFAARRTLELKRLLEVRDLLQHIDKDLWLFFMVINDIGYISRTVNK